MQDITSDSKHCIKSQQASPTILSQVFSHNDGPRFAHKTVATPWGAEGNVSQVPVDEVSSHGGFGGTGGGLGCFGGGLGCPVVDNNGSMIPGTITAGDINGTIGNFISKANAGLPKLDSQLILGFTNS